MSLVKNADTELSRLTVSMGASTNHGYCSDGGDGLPGQMNIADKEIDMFFVTIQQVSQIV